MAEAIISGPFGEFNLTDHRGHDPSASLHLGVCQTLVPPAPSDRRLPEAKRTSFLLQGGLGEYNPANVCNAMTTASMSSLRERRAAIV